jgi:hypothetical protein
VFLNPHAPPAELISSARTHHAVVRHGIAIARVTTNEENANTVTRN